MKRKWFLARLMCQHKYEPIPDVRGFFGITQCVKCGAFSRLPFTDMKITTFRVSVDLTSGKNQPYKRREDV